MLVCVRCTLFGISAGADVARREAPEVPASLPRMEVSSPPAAGGESEEEQISRAKAQSLLDLEEIRLRRQNEYNSRVNTGAR